MKSSNIMIVIAAVLMAASFAGIAMVDDEADAAVGDYTITYTYDGMTADKEVDSPADLIAPSAIWADAPSEGKWIIDDKEYTIDAKYTFSVGVTKVTATYVPEEVTITVNGQTVTGLEGPVAYNTSITIKTGESWNYADGVLTAPLQNAEEKYFAGFATSENGKVVYTTSIAATQDMTLYAVYEDDVEITFISEKTDLDYRHGYYELIEAFGSEEKGKTIDDILKVPSMENHTFIGWKSGDALVITHNAAGYALAQDKDGNVLFTKDMTTLTAEYQPMNISVTLKVEGQADRNAPAIYGEKLVEPALPEGCAYWAVMTKEAVLDDEGKVVEPAVYERFDFDNTVITEAITLYAIAEEEVPDESIYATFNIEGTIYGPYKVTDRFSIPQTDREGYNFLGWTVQGGDGTKLTSAQVQNYQYTEDVTFVAVYEVAEPPAPEEPGFFETNTGKTVAVVIAFVIVLFIAALYLNLWNLRTRLFGWKIERKGME